MSFILMTAQENISARKAVADYFRQACILLCGLGAKARASLLRLLPLSAFDCRSGASKAHYICLTLRSHFLIILLSGASPLHATLSCNTARRATSFTRRIYFFSIFRSPFYYFVAHRARRCGERIPSASPASSPEASARGLRDGRLRQTHESDKRDVISAMTARSIFVIDGYTSSGITTPSRATYGRWLFADRRRAPTRSCA